MSNDIVIIEPDDVLRAGISNIKEEDLPQVIQGQMSKLKDLDKSVKEAMKASALAKESAMNASYRSAGFGKKKVAIEELQSVGVDLAKAVQSGAEAQKISFEFQTKLAEISKHLFSLGISNIASNRFVVRELEMRLKGASKEELSDLARQELMMVVKQLKEQEDVLRKLDNLTSAVKSQAETLNVNFQQNQELKEQLQAQQEIDMKHREQLKKQAKTSKRLEEQLSVLADTDKQLDEQLKLVDGNIGKHEERLKQVTKEIGGHEEKLTTISDRYHQILEQVKNNRKTIEEQEIKIDLLQSALLDMKTLLDAKSNKTIVTITLAVAVIAFLLSMFSFFL